MTVASAASAQTPARAGLVGHPSDGFGGATLAVSVANFHAAVRVKRSTVLHIAPDGGGQWPEGGLPLVEATVERFARHCARIGVAFDDRLRIRYGSTIPRQLGLGGSSAIVISTLRAIAELAGVQMAPERLAALALAVETEQLGIAAGLQDRVVQSHGGLVFMDFDSGHVAEHGHGRYERLDVQVLPPLFLAWRPDAGGSSSDAHAGVRERFEGGDSRTRGAMKRLAELAHEARAALVERDHTAFAAALDGGHDVRASIYELDPRHAALVACARARGLSATYTGSGGAIVGIAGDPDAVKALGSDLDSDGVQVRSALIGDPPRERP